MQGIYACCNGRRTKFSDGLPPPLLRSLPRTIASVLPSRKYIIGRYVIAILSVRLSLSFVCNAM